MNQATAALDFKSAHLYALRAVLRDADSERLATALAAHMARAGSLFAGEPVVIDASLLPEDATVDWSALCAALRAQQLPPIGAVADGNLRAAAQAAGLAALELGGAGARSAAAAAAPTTPATAPSSETAPPPETKETKETNAPGSTPGLLVTRPLRSGQRIYARGSDLTVVGMVSPGAEVLADGNIHVYGPLRGKAMAGARGNAAARIFTTQFDPELVAVAGVYHVVEQRLDAALANRPAQVWLDGERLRTAAL